MDLTTNYLGLVLAHPFMPGASPLVADIDGVRRLEDAGASAIVLHSLFEEQIVRDQLSQYEHWDRNNNAHVEALSYLPPPESFSFGPDEYLEHLRRVKEAVAVPVIGSLNGGSLGGWIEYATLMEKSGADAIELNVYSVAADPDLTAMQIEENTIDVLRAVKKAVRIPVALKLSPYYTSLANFAKRADDAGVNGFVLFNRFFQPDIDPEALEVRRRLELSTAAELPLRLRWLAILSPKVRASLAVTGGIHEATDAIKALMAGATAVQMTSALLRGGVSRLSIVRDQTRRWMEARGYETIADLCGTMNLDMCPDPAAYERANYVLTLQSWPRNARTPSKKGAGNGAAEEEAP